MKVLSGAVITQQAVAQLLGFKTLAVIYLPTSIVQQAVAQMGKL